MPKYVGSIKMKFKEKPVTKTERIEEIERELAALKAEVVKEEEVEYPCVMISTAAITKGRAVLFTSKNKGTELTNTYLQFGDYSTDWAMDTFTKFTGKLSFKNGKPV